jgi:glycosyltransferase involved in cell wall biosynthesis
MREKTILFVAHNAGYTGAPILLLNFLRWFKANSELPFVILLRIGGKLADSYKELAPVINLDEGYWGYVRRKLRYLNLEVDHNLFDRAIIRRRLSREEIGLVYSNTITNGYILDHLSNLDCPVVTHVHELENWIRNQTGATNVSLVKRYTHHYIAVSQAVRCNLVQNHGIAGTKIDMIPEFIISNPRNSKDNHRKGSSVREELGIPNDALVVGGSGTIDWRKGADLFVSLAEKVMEKTSKEIYFVWIGGEIGGRQFRNIRRQVCRTGVADKIIFTGFRQTPLTYYSEFDIFALTSREDPFPLVMLETASLGIPIVCFDESGGCREFVKNDCGFVVPYLDLECMGQRVLTLLDSPDLRRTQGKSARKKVLNNYDISKIAPKILRVIEEYYLR